MSTRFLPTLLVTAAMMGPAAKAADEPPVGKAPPSNAGDLGKADPLSPLENRKDEAPIPPPEVQAMPEFKEVPPATGDASGGDAADPNAGGGSGGDASTGTRNAESPSDSAPAEPPAPPKKKKKRAAKKVVREESFVTGGAPDSPDDRREQAFHRIYEKYNSAPTPLEAWEQASAARQSEVYKVQKKDTLWDLSKTLFGDPNYWPKIWALNNDEVLNPHEIETWMQIRFFPGDLNEPPTVAVAEAPKAAAAPAASGDEALMPAPKRVHPIIRALPKSIPQWKMEAAQKVLPSFEAIQPRAVIPVANISLAYSATETPLKGVGEIKETELGMKTASEYQYVFVEASDTSSRVFTVVKDVGFIVDPRFKNQDPPRGAHLLEYQGEIEIVEPVSDRVNLQRAIVRKNLAPIEIGAKLVPGHLEMVNVEDGAPSSAARAEIVGSQFNTNRRLTDAGGIVFLNAGTAAGLQDGMVLPVFSNVRLRNPGTRATTHDRQIAHAKVVRLTENYATAVLTSVWDDVQVGDSVGGSSANESPADSLGSAPPVAPPTGGSGDAVVPDATHASGDDSLDFEGDSSEAPAGKAPAPPPADDGGAVDDEDLTL